MYPDSIDKFTEKLNKIDNNTYVIEEEVTLKDGVYHGNLNHDNVSATSINVYSGKKLTGEKIDNFILSTPSKTPWKKNIKIFSNYPVVYITYETQGDTIEAEDINIIQESIVNTQKEIDRYKDAINNIQIGGRNYIKDYQFKKEDIWKKSGKEAQIDTTQGYGYLSGTTENPFLYQDLETGLVKKGDTLTLQYEVKFDGVTANTGTYSFLVRTQLTGYLNDKMVQDIGIFGKHESDGLYLNQGWQKVVKTITITSNAVFDYARFRLYARNFNGTIYFRKVKLEKGSKATDLSPAPEDIDSAINSKANANDVYKKLETYTKAEADNKFATKNEIADTGNGDMTKAVYDTNKNGIVDKAESVEWGGILNKPTRFTPSTHKHTKAQISDFPSSLPANGGNADTLDNKHASDFMKAGPLKWNDLKGV